MLQLWKRRALCMELPSKEIHTLQQKETCQPHWPRRRRGAGLWNAGCPRTRHGGISSHPIKMHAPRRPDVSGKRNGSLTGFSLSLIRLALVRQINSNNVYLSARKSMTLQFYIWLIAKRAKGVALIDSGAIKNFMNLDYARWLKLPIKELKQHQPLFNVDRWHGGLLGCICLLIFLPFISIFPTLRLESSSLPLHYFTYTLIHSSPVL